MTAESTTPVTPADAQRASFFRQSGWLMIANVSSGMLMWAVHFLNQWIKDQGEYGTFGVFLAVVMLVPTLPLQMVLAQQTARALATNTRAELSGVIRLFWGITSAVWVLGAATVLLFQGRIVERWALASPLAIWITLPIVLFTLWTPLFWGVMQGRQNFLWLGWSMLSNGISRIIVASVAVIALSAGAAGMMSGVLCGTFCAAAISIWQTRDLWAIQPRVFDWRKLLGQIVPLTLAFLGFQILFTADTVLVGMWFGGAEKDAYVAAGTLSRALMWLVLPLAAVMFPRIVQSAARAEKSNLMGLVLAGTGILALAGALSLWVLGPWIVQLVYKHIKLDLALSALPWYAMAMVPLSLANVLLNNLFARPAARLVPAVCVLAVAAGYLAALTQFHGSIVTVLQVLGAANLALLGVVGWFSWRARGEAGPRP